jgi:hypothetical protein
MTLFKLFKRMLQEQFPDGRIEASGNYGDSRLSAHMMINGRLYRLSVETHEMERWLLLHLYHPFRVPAAKHTEACILFNTINDRYSYTGRITVSDDGVVCCRQIILIEDIVPTMSLLKGMLESAIKLFENNTEEIMRVSSDYSRTGKSLSL